MKHKIKTTYRVFSQKNWKTKTLRSSPLPRELAYKLRAQLKAKGYVHALIVQVIALD